MFIMMCSLRRIKFVHIPRTPTKVEHLECPKSSGRGM